MRVGEMHIDPPLFLGERRYVQPFPDFPRAEAFVCGNGLRVIGSTDTEPDGLRWRHISVSFADRYPAWDELKAARYQFFGDDVEVLQFFPPKSEYVNIHSNCFHLWSRCDRVQMNPNRERR